MFQCVSCGNTKFHLTFYHSFTMPLGIPEVIQSDTEARCVICHKTYLVSEIENGFSKNTPVDGPKPEEPVTEGQPTGKKSKAQSS